MTRDATEPIARELVGRGLAEPALILLEAHRPLRPLVGLAATFLLPVVRPLLGAAADDLRSSVDDDRSYDRLVERLREGAG